MKPSLFLLLCGLVFGCSACARLSSNIYEGVQLQKRQEAPPSLADREQAEQTLSYDEYLRQRRRVTENPPVSSAPAATPAIP